MSKRSSSANKLVRLLLTLVFLLTALIPLGCGSEAEVGSDSLTFTDDLGRSVTVKKSPERVAALIGSFADVWQLAGGKVSATASDAWSDFELELYGAIDLGGAHSPNLELLLGSDPELVLASASTSADVEMMGALENAGITVAYFEVNGIEDYLRMLKICTEITGRDDLYEKNGLEVLKRVEEIKSDLAESDIPSEKRRVLVLRAASTFVKAKNSEGTVLGQMLADLGCINIADSDESLLENLSVESVLRDEPYRIFVVTMGSDTEAAIASFDRMISENPAWSSLGAIKEGRVYHMEKRLFNQKPNARWDEAYEKLSDILKK